MQGHGRICIGYRICDMSLTCGCSCASRASLRRSRSAFRCCVSTAPFSCPLTSSKRRPSSSSTSRLLPFSPSSCSLASSSFSSKVAPKLLTTGAGSSDSCPTARHTTESHQWHAVGTWRMLAMHRLAYTRAALKGRSLWNYHCYNWWAHYIL